MYAHDDPDAADYERFPDQPDVDLVASLVGHRITAAVWFDQNPDGYWGGENETLDLTLDDGRVIRCGGWGSDAWGATIAEVPAAGPPAE